MDKSEKESQNCPECGYPAKAGHRTDCKSGLISNTDIFNYSESQEHAKEAQEHLSQIEGYIRETIEHIEYLMDHRKFAESTNEAASQNRTKPIYDISEIDKDIEKARSFLSELESDRTALQELNVKIQENHARIKELLNQPGQGESVN